MSSAMDVDSEHRTHASNASAHGGDEERSSQNNDDNEDDYDEDDEEESEEEVLEPKILPKRATRGTRISNVHGEGDDEFWEQEFFQDTVEEDQDYEKDDAEADDEPDEVDSDFDDEEDAIDSDEEVSVDKEKKVKKAGAYVDPKALAAKRAAAAKKAAATKAAKKAAAAAIDNGIVKKEDGTIDTGAVDPLTVYYDDDGFPTGEIQGGPAELYAAAQKRKNLPISLLAHAHGRKSIRQTTVDKALELHKREAEAEKKRRDMKPKAKFVQKILTQDEQLKQSIETEKENEISLQQLLKIEEEKKKELAPKLKSLGDRVLYKSFKNSKGLASVTISFTNQDVPEYLQPEVPMPSLHHALCVITQQPAKYLDSVTGLPYASLPAFQALRSKPAPEIKKLQQAQEAKRAETLAKLQAEAAAALPNAPASSGNASKKRKHEEVKTIASPPAPGSVVPSSSASVASSSATSITPTPRAASPSPSQASAADESPKASKAKKQRVKAPAKPKK